MAYLYCVINFYYSKECEWYHKVQKIAEVFLLCPNMLRKFCNKKGEATPSFLNVLLLISESLYDSRFNNRSKTNGIIRK